VDNRIASKLLTLVDGVEPTSEVIVPGATNCVSVIKPALKRPGRFCRELDMGVPGMDGRLEILQIKTRDMKLLEDVDLSLVAKATHGCVGEDIQQLCTEAALECIRFIIPSIDVDTFWIPSPSTPLSSTPSWASSILPLVEKIKWRRRKSWEDVGGMEEPSANSTKPFSILWSTPKNTSSLACLPARASCFTDRRSAAKLCWPRPSPTSAGPIS